MTTHETAMDEEFNRRILTWLKEKGLDAVELDKVTPTGTEGEDMESLWKAVVHE